MNRTVRYGSVSGQGLNLQEVSQFAYCPAERRNHQGPGSGLGIEIEPELLARLPIVAYADRRQHLKKIAVYSYLLAVYALVTVFGVAGPFLGTSILVKLMSPIAVFLSIPWLAWFLPVTFTLISDMRTRGPVLTIDSHGFVDNRRGISVAWTEVRSIRLIWGHIGSNVTLYSGVTIRLKDKRKVPPPTWKRLVTVLPTKPDEFHCSLVYLTEGADRMAFTMCDLVKAAGGAFWNPRKKPHSMWKATAEVYTHIFKRLIEALSPGRR